MGFMDKAKKMAEQAQAKLDEAQKQFNSGQGGQQQGGGPAVEYDKHGRPIQPAPVTPDAAAPVRRGLGSAAGRDPGVPPTEAPSRPRPSPARRRTRPHRPRPAARRPRRRRCPAPRRPTTATGPAPSRRSSRAATL